mmetsp:Transcript_3369/g.9423  ORF Transcript_3369/g.9423 Transcript_3369/m.9423 type:complete len:216 (-) Transcript_3369:1103-1750(-)
MQLGRHSRRMTLEVVVRQKHKARVQPASCTGRGGCGGMCVRAVLAAAVVFAVAAKQRVPMALVLPVVCAPTEHVLDRLSKTPPGRWLAPVRAALTAECLRHQVELRRLRPLLLVWPRIGICVCDCKAVVTGSELGCAGQRRLCQDAHLLRPRRAPRRGAPRAPRQPHRCAAAAAHGRRGRRRGRVQTTGGGTLVRRVRWRPRMRGRTAGSPRELI